MVISDNLCFSEDFTTQRDEEQRQRGGGKEGGGGRENLRTF